MRVETFVSQSVSDENYWYATIRAGSETPIGIGRSEKEAAERGVIALERAIQSLRQIISEAALAATKGEG